MSKSQENRRKILDPCCGGKMFWFDNKNPNVIFGDIRDESHILCDGRKLEISPDEIMDFKSLRFNDESFKLVVFDPPHLVTAGDKGWQKKKYGKLDASWQEDLRQGFKECFRVLEVSGVLIFKWNETQIKTNEILKLTTQKPLFGHISGKRANTHWVCFMKQ